MVSFGNLAMFFLGIEVLSISLYVLAASNRLNLKSNEAGMKYFLMGSFASGIILFGICLIYGAMGSFDVLEISELSQSAELPIWFPIGIAMVTIGMLFTTQSPLFLLLFIFALIANSKLRDYIIVTALDAVFSLVVLLLIYMCTANSISSFQIVKSWILK